MKKGKPCPLKSSFYSLFLNCLKLLTRVEEREGAGHIFFSYSFSSEVAYLHLSQPWRACSLSNFKLTKVPAGSKH